LDEHKRRFAHEHGSVDSLLDAVEALRPTALVGVSGMPQTFTEPVVRAMARLNKRPVIFALSNPTSNAECTAEQAYEWSEGRGIFASGSPFAPVTLDGVTHVPGQGNNSYIFPGVGLGVLASGSSRVTDEMFYTAASVLAGLVTEEDLRMGRVYPDLKRIREVSLAIGTKVADIAFTRGLADAACPADLRAHVEATRFDPKYESYV
jgi:malate dehydrogenase (oxaloacetate-decarboxylating)(NADP+)